MVAIQPEMGGVWTFKSFLVIVLGGAGNYPGALLGGMLLGLVEQLASLFLTTQVRGGRLRPAGPGPARPAQRPAGRAPDVMLPRAAFLIGLVVVVVALAVYPVFGHRLRRPGRAADVHVDRAGRVVEPDLRPHGLRLLRPRGLLRHRRLRRRHPHHDGRLGVAAGRAGRRRRRLPAGPADRLSVPAAQGAVLRHRHARAQRGAARARLVLRGIDRRRQRALAAHPGRLPGYLLRDGRAGRGRRRRHLPDRDLALRSAADDDPRGRGGRRGDGHRHLPLQALRLPALRRRARHRRRRSPRATRATSSRSACSR